MPVIFKRGKALFFRITTSIYASVCMAFIACFVQRLKASGSEAQSQESFINDIEKALQDLGPAHFGNGHFWYAELGSSSYPPRGYPDTSLTPQA